ncbi:MAG: 6-bladed beta-propeller [bacterium]|nr:6-bladed beta-propeller [bacterium]
MKILILLVAIPVLLSAQAVARNPDKPLNENAGRVLNLKLEATASDQDGDFIFKGPTNILSLNDGTFFLTDNGKVLKFDKDGTFLRVVAGKGEGPAEATYLSQLFVRNDEELVVNTGLMRKLMVFDFNGKLKEEYRNRKNVKMTRTGLSVGEGSFHILGALENLDFIAIPHGSPNVTNGKDNLKQYQVMLLSQKNVWQEKLFEIPVPATSFKTAYGNMSVASYNIISISNSSYVYYSNTFRYEIKCYNIKQEKIESIWKRDYKPVMILKQENEKYRFGVMLGVSSRKKFHKYQAPPRKDFPDIQKMFVINDNLWVITSTIDKEKGVLVDVFDQKGRYSDHFYLLLPTNLDLHNLYRSPISISNNGNHLIITERDEEDNFKVVKYRMIDDA